MSVLFFAFWPGPKPWVTKTGPASPVAEVAPAIPGIGLRAPLEPAPQ